MAREFYRLAEIPTAEAYAFALFHANVSDDLRSVLLKHSTASQAELACSALAAMSGVAIATLNSQYGQLGRRIKEILGLTVPTYSETNTRLLVISALVEVSRSSSRSPWSWRLYPEVCAAIDQLGWAQP